MPQFFVPHHVLAWGLAIATVLLASIATAGEDANDADKAAKIDQLVSHYQQRGYLNGAVLVAKNGRVLYVKGVGEANLESHVPNTPQTKFDIASITKQFTAILVLQQVAKGNVRFTGTVHDYLPWYRNDTGSRMTIDQLLHHTSGLPADFDLPQFSDSSEAARHYKPEEFAKKFCQPDLMAEPGTKWAYSNCGYILLGLVLEKVTGKSFDDLLRDQILTPLGMKNSGMDHNDLTQLGGASGYIRHAGPRYVPGPYLDRGRIFAAGAMYSTVEDLFQWNQALSSGKLLPLDLREHVFKAVMNDWACGWFVHDIPGGQPGAGSSIAQMQGDMPGNYFACIIRYPDQDGVVIVLRNGYGSTEQLEANLQAVFFDCPPSLPSRKPKDFLAHAGQVTYASIAAHRFTAGCAVLFVAALFWRGHRRQRYRNPSTVL